jgi:SNF2 family DNA or RNA helicase
MGKLEFDGQRFWFTPVGSAEIIDGNCAGLIACSDGLRWSTRSAAKAVTLRRFADAQCELKLKNTFITTLEAPEYIPYPHHLQPKLYQLETVWHCVTRTPAYNADEAGLGKTIESVLCMNAVPGRVLIICPPFLKYNWADEIEKWSTHVNRQIDGQDIFIVESGDVSRDDLAGHHYTILPDSIIDSPSIQHYLKDEKFEWLFIDEAHRYGNPDTNRTVALIGSDKDDKAYFTYTSLAKRVIYLSGTPTPNGRPIELYPLLSRTAPESIRWRSLTKFGQKFCNGRQVTRYEGKRRITNWDFSGASSLQSFRKQLRSKFMVRHLKKDVLRELPPKTRKLVFLDAPKVLVAYESELLKHYTMKELLGDKAVELGDIARYQREVGQAKVVPAAEYIIDLLENNPGKLIVGAHHIEVVLQLSKRLVKFGCLTIRGGMTAKIKADRVKRFQNVEACRVVVGNISSMGLGLTLTKASTAIVVEPSWVPGVNEQFEDRIHRITQKANVDVRYLVLRGTLDERKLRSVLSKEQNINQVMGS